AGVALLCECGHECLSHQHSYSCSLSNFTIIRKREGPIRTFDDAKTTPKCMLCESYPKTIVGYQDHLYVHHHSTLLSKEVFLRCLCGFELHHNDFDHTHTKKVIFLKFVVVVSSHFEIWMDRYFNSSKKRMTRRKLRIIYFQEKSGIDKNENALKKENHKVNTIYRAMSEISEGEHGVRSLYRALCRRIDEVASIKLPLSQCKALLRMFEKSEERLKGGDEFLDLIYHSNRNMSVEIRKKEMRKLIRGISTRIILAKLAEFKKKFVNGVEGNENITWKK
ncbi:hypothetical protein PMAYCL1PPCAC_13459, partial [Pristionchus mayeri]